MTTLELDVCVVGGGPAGSVTALHLARLGHRVGQIERCAFPRAHVGESLTRGVLPILDVLGLSPEGLGGAALVAGEARVRWAEPRTELLGPSRRGLGLLVDRGRFDALLLAAAAAAGVRVLQPARVRHAGRREPGWRLEVEARREVRSIAASWLVDATGRSGFLRGRRERVSPRTVALCGRLRHRLDQPVTLVEALPDGWCWAAPIPGGLLSTIVLLDTDALRSARRGTLEELFRAKLTGAELLADLSSLPLAGAATARDATAYFATDPVERRLLRVGEASFGLDPLSSTGVEKAMQSGLVAAVALSTILRRPDREALCASFYRDRQREIVSTHAAWSAGFHRVVTRFAERPFWRMRSPTIERPSPEPGSETEPALSRAALSSVAGSPAPRVRLSDGARFVDEPCIVGDEIRAHPALLHPSLERPLAFLEGVAVQPLVDMVAGSADLGRLLERWSSVVSPGQAQRIAAWLLRRRILELVTLS